MRFRVLLPLLATITMLLVPGCSRWEEFIAPDGSFAVSLPGKPDRGTKVLPSPVGPLDVQGFEVGNFWGSMRYAVYYVDLAEDVNVREEVPGGPTVLETKVVTMRGYRGVEIIHTNGDGSFTRERNVQIERRFYALYVGSATRARLASQDAERFFESFRLLKR